MEKLYTKKELKRAVKRVSSKLKFDRRIRRGSKSIHFLINIKSHNYNPYYQGSEIRQHLRLVLNGNKSWNGDLRRWLGKKFWYMAFEQGPHDRFVNQFNCVEIDELPF